MKSKIFIIIFLFVFPFFVNAGDIYVNVEIFYESTKGEKRYIPCESLIGRFTNGPVFYTKSWKKVYAKEYVCQSTCWIVDTSKPRLYLSDFSFGDVLGIIMNVIILIALFLLPIGLFFLVNRYIRRPYLKIIFNILIFVLFIIILFYFFGYVSSFCYCKSCS